MLLFMMNLFKIIKFRAYFSRSFNSLSEEIWFRICLKILFGLDIQISSKSLINSKSSLDKRSVFEKFGSLSSLTT